MDSTYLTTTTGTYGGKDQKPTSFYAAPGAVSTSTGLNNSTYFGSTNEATNQAACSYGVPAPQTSAQSGKGDLELRVSCLEVEMKALIEIAQILCNLRPKPTKNALGCKVSGNWTIRDPKDRY